MQRSNQFHSASRSLVPPHSRWIAVLCLVLTAFVGVGGVAFADEDQLLFDLYRLQATAEGEVPNDLLSAELVVEDEDRDAASLANRINASMGWALEQMKRYPGVKAESGNYNTWPKHERKTNRIIGWRSSQSLKIESDDFAAARKAINSLQERLTVRGMQLTAKPATRKAREDQLINEALNAFKARATLVMENMGSGTYRIVDLDINTHSGMQPYPRPQMRGMEMSMSKMAEPAIAAGTSTVAVTVSGRVQLQ